MYQLGSQPISAPATIPGLVVEYASFPRRFFARCLDGFIVTLMVIPVKFALDRLLDNTIHSPFTNLQVVAGFLLVMLAYFTVDFLYFSITTASRHQATFGKRALDIYVTDFLGNPLTYERSAGRVLANYLTDLTFLIGYLIQPFTRHRQALHDKVSGTLVLRGQYASTVPADYWSRNRNQIVWEPSCKSGWKTGLLVGIPVCLLLIGSCGYLVAVPAGGGLLGIFEDETQTAMTSILTFQVDNAIDAMAPSQTVLRLDEFSLDVNTVVVEPGSGHGVEISTNGPTAIYGFETVIDKDGVAVWGNEVVYLGVPSIVDGQVQFTKTRQGGIVDRYILPPDAIEKAFEDGINQALLMNRLTAIDVSLANGVLKITTAAKPLEFAPRAEPSETGVVLKLVA